ncbi:hypothetical protein EJV47_16230 [Hymenobacter gummosus]|uniref:Uncharacterized protein n=1 Tax=Hymenobacter gummosus TaxID=1776032 RepID=A0A3S0K466_9BACT|nr:hypothetical protein [Hymenobacter gummosus]RTQ48518.1 hypothetical protein EJV47_16230 [Hymenobacter gummosus]
MGMFNTLHAPLLCPACHFICLGSFQFNFGMTWLLDYQLGDRLEWDGGRSDIGVPQLPKVKIYALLVNVTCPNCGATRGEYEDEFDLYAENDVLLSLMPMETYDIYANEPKAEGQFAIVYSW